MGQTIATVSSDIDQGLKDSVGLIEVDKEVVGKSSQAEGTAWAKAWRDDSVTLVLEVTAFQQV